MTYETLLFEMADGVAVVTLNRPEARNALNVKMREELGELVLRLRDDDAVKSVLLRGAGEAFCAGGDVKFLREAGGSAPATRARVRAAHVWSPELAMLEKPVIAAVDGPAYGGGFSLALMADFVLATPEARFCCVQARMGMVADLSAMYFLPRIVGLQTAKEICLTGREISAEEALDYGILYGIYPRAELMAAAMDVAGRFRVASTEGIGMAKQILNQAFHLDQRALVELEAYSQSVAMETDYHHVAVRRFLDKKPLEFAWESFER